MLEQSTIGVIATHGNPLGDENNAVIGADAFLRNDEFLGDKVLTGTFWVQRSFTGAMTDFG